MEESLAEYLFTHIVNYGVIILKEVVHVARKKKRIPAFDHTDRKSSENKARGLYFSKALFKGLIFGGAYIRRRLSMEGN